MKFSFILALSLSFGCSLAEEPRVDERTPAIGQPSSKPGKDVEDTKSTESTDTKAVDNLLTLNEFFKKYKCSVCHYYYRDFDVNSARSRNQLEAAVETVTNDLMPIGGRTVEQQDKQFLRSFL